MSGDSGAFEALVAVGVGTAVRGERVSGASVIAVTDLALLVRAHADREARQVPQGVREGVGEQGAVDDDRPGERAGVGSALPGVKVDDRLQAACADGIGPAGGGAEGVAAIRDDLARVRTAAEVLVDQVNTGVAFVGSGCCQVHGGDHEGHLGCAEGAGVDGEVEIEAAEDIAGCGVGAGAVSLARVGVDGVHESAVGAGAQPAGLVRRTLAARRRCVRDREVVCGDVGLGGPGPAPRPRLVVGGVDRHHPGEREAVGKGRVQELPGELADADRLV
ncbi:hypothetical protein OG883_15305 [Streptomyces sp. NBC_01142]|uniref:hypothetical protein n=1 Tax=Streptomyces sp. NBC_01142 TaxID=2975865 RepID=UPI00225AACA6|nr:hypothetical protein [Streptomyces sp. NBC_01142]MCX4821253.1 hypothetical protein [Streptomyces sp. NBC_01142]